MAITAVYYNLVRGLFEQGLLPQRGAILEIGEANMYGDVTIQNVDDDICKYVADPARRDQLLGRSAALASNRQNEWVLFDQAKLFYEVFFAPAQVQAIDFNGSPIAQKLDLNHPVKLDRKFDVTFNHGTAEHVFNIAQVFRTIHEYTLSGGLMIHEGPFTGWIEHGFYNLQPTLFFDLADVNHYELVAMYVEDSTARTAQPISGRSDVYDYARADKLPANSQLFVALRKALVDRPFEIPIQGYYRGILPPAGREAWMELR
jgi:hypothetical protein